MNNKFGLMLGGGGAKGAYQLGVIKALYEHNLLDPIEVISGTSIGAINAFLCASVPTMEEFINIWKLIDEKYVFKDKRKDGQGLFDINLICEILMTKLDIDYFRHYGKQVYVTATQITTNKATDQLNFSKLKKEVFNLNTFPSFTEAVLASASIPFVFGPTMIDAKMYVDGGLLNQNPYDCLIKDGCNIIFAVSLGLKVPKLIPGYYDYTKKDILNIDFLMPKYFFSTVIGDLSQATKFNDKFKERIYYLGYCYAIAMIKKLFDNKILYYEGHKLMANKPKGYSRITLDQDEILKVKKQYKRYIANK